MANIKRALTLNVKEIPAGGKQITFAFSKNEIDELNKTYFSDDSSKLISLKGELFADYMAGKKIIKVNCKVNSKILTNCSITGDIIELPIDEEVDVDYSFYDMGLSNTEETFLPPELIIDNEIDLFAVIIDTVILSLPSNPVSPDVDLEKVSYSDNSANGDILEDENPFSILKKIIK